MNSGKRARRIASHYILSPLGLLPRAILSLSPDGTVEGIEQVPGVDPAAGIIDSAALIDSIQGVEFYAGILIPGVVNAHTHLELSHLAGKIPPGGGFSAFAAALSKVRGGFTHEEKLASAQFRHAKMYAEGVAAVGDISNSADSLPVKSSGGIFYHTFLELYGLGRNSLGGIADLQREAAAMGLRSSVTPHSTYSLNEEAFRAAVGGEENAPLSIHFMESPGEAQLYRGEGEFAAWYSREGYATDFTGKYASPAERVIANVPGDRKILLVHNTFVSESDVRALQAHFGENLTWVLCPRSNLRITGELPPAQMIRRLGGRIAVGTDSLASNDSLSLAAEIALFPEIPLLERLRWITADGAAALGIADEFGSFEEGKRSGAALLTGVNWGTMQLGPEAAIRRIV